MDPKQDTEGHGSNETSTYKRRLFLRSSEGKEKANVYSTRHVLTLLTERKKQDKRESKAKADQHPESVS
jgi:hypothetical protein